MPFEKGKSGNPEGRRAEDRKLKLLARQHTEEAVKKLASWMKSDNPKASVSAACALLDRGWGKPKEHVQIDQKVELIDVGSADSLADKLKQALGRRTGPTVPTLQ